MSLTLGLNTALSGLLTSQRGLDVISQNVVNVNTKGYTRKVMNQETRVRAGEGAGVQEGSVTRMVNEGLLKDIRKQNSDLGKLQTEQTYYPRIDDLFGEVGDQASIAHKVSSLKSAFDILSTEANQPAVQWSTVQSGLDVTSSLNQMSDQLQALRVQADRDIEQTVTLINEQLDNIYDLNQKIVKNSAISTGTGDLEDQRDLALTQLSEYIDVQYYKRSDNSTVVFTSAGELLLDNQPQHLNYTSNSAIQPWMTAAGGHFNKISVDGGSADLGPKIASGKLRALLDFRDSTLSDLQANIDQLSVQMQDVTNQVHNRGTIQPAIANHYEGSRVFINPGVVTPSPTGNDDDTAVFYMGASTLDATTGGAGGAGYGSLSFGQANTTTPWQTTLTSSAGLPFSATTFKAGTVFSIGDAENSGNNGTYRVVSYDSASQITVEKVNNRQTMQLAGENDDVVLATFDASGNQLQQTTLNTIMQMDFSGSYTTGTVGSGRTLADFTGKASRGDWSIPEVTAHIEGWLNSQGYNNAEVNLNEEGKLVIDMGTQSVSLAFRDQDGSTAGSESKDATIAFDVNGDGATDQTIKGFANFFGLNDFFTPGRQNFMFDSDIKPATFKTTQSRTLEVYDNTGKLGNSIVIPAGSTLEDMAEAINAQTRSNESAPLSTDNWDLTTQATISVANESATRLTITVPAVVPGNVSLYEIAGQLSQNGLTASVVEDKGGYRLRVTDSGGRELSVTVNNGAMSGGKTLGSVLDMTPRRRFAASVVPEGSGFRLRVVQSQGSEMYLSSPLDAQKANLLTDLGMTRSASGMASTMGVRADLQTAPEKISRGAMRWNEDNQKYYLSEGDNTTALQLGDAFATKQAMGSSGGIFAGNYTFDQFASTTISMSASVANHSKDTFAYQTTLSQSLNFQYTSYSGVNLDEEVSSMIDFQQAYSAAAKVITTLQEMLQTLTEIIR